MVEDNFFKNLANLIVYHRKQSGLSRIELAQIAGVGKTVVYDIEHAKQTVRFNTLLKVLKVLNIIIEFKSPLIPMTENVTNEKS